MRWGISNEVTSRHLTTATCLNEIKTCQKYSVGPNFIVNIHKKLLYLSKKNLNKIKNKSYY